MNQQQSGRWQVKSIRTRLRNPWFGVVTKRCILPDGSELDMHVVDFPRPAVGVIAQAGDSILLIRQYRVTIDEYVWAIPSGGTAIGELPETAARRELLEETGYRARQLRHLVSYNPSYGATNQRFELYLADEPEKTKSSFDQSEVIDCCWFSKSDVLEMVMSNAIVDGLSLTPLALLFLEQRLGDKASQGPLRLKPRRSSL